MIPLSLSGQEKFPLWVGCGSFLEQPNKYIMQYEVYDHHSDNKWSNWIFLEMLAVYRYVEAK